MPKKDDKDVIIAGLEETIRELREEVTVLQMDRNAAVDSMEDAVMTGFFNEHDAPSEAFGGLSDD